MPEKFNSAQIPVAVRQYIIREVLLLVCATPVFLWFAPQNIYLYGAMALAFFVYVMATAKTTKRVVWQNRKPNSKAAWLFTASWTVPVAIVFFVFGYQQNLNFNGKHLLLSLLIYLIWALLQQTLFQFYFLGRLRVLFSNAPVWLLCGICASAYSLVHLPDYPIVFVTIAAGCLWSYSYYHHGALIPLAASHAILASAYYFNVAEKDLLAVWLGGG